ALLGALVIGLLLFLARESPMRGPVANGGLAAESSTSEGIDPLDTPNSIDRAQVASQESPPSSESKAPAQLDSALRTMRLHVVDGVDEQPLADARVETFGSNPGVVTTDASGSCEIQTQTDARSIRLFIDCEGYFHVRGEIANVPEVTLKLRRTITLKGHVLDAETLAPIPRARMTIRHNECRGCNPEPILADVNGAYELPDVPVVRAGILINAEDYSAKYFSFDVGASGEQIEQDFKLERGLAIRGHVVDFSSGAALAGASLRSDENEIVADSSGAFACRVMPDSEGSVRFEATAPDRCRLCLVVRLDQRSSLESLELRIPESPIVEGIVHDANATLIEGASVNVGLDYAAQARSRQKRPRAASPLDKVPASWNFEDAYGAHGKSDSSGRFRVKGLVPWGENREIRAGAPGHKGERIAMDRLAGPGESTRIDLLLARAEPESGCKLKGRVRMNGIPVDCTVRSSCSGGEWSKRVEARQDYEFGRVPAGNLTLRAEPTDIPGPFEGNSFVTTVTDGQKLSHDFELRAPTLSITGRVQYLDGAPAVGAKVGAACSGSNELWTYQQSVCAEVRTGMDGSFVLDVPDRDFSLRVEAQLSAARARLEGIRPGARDVLLQISRSGTLFLRAIDAGSRAPLSSRSLAFATRRAGEESYSDVGEWRTAPDLEGWGQLNFLEGRVEILVRGGSLGFKPVQTLADIPPDGETRLEIALEKGLEVNFRLDPHADEKWPGYSIYVLEPELLDGVRSSKKNGGNYFSGGPMFPGLSIRDRTLHFDASGGAQLRGFTAGRYGLKLLTDAVILESKEIVLTDETRDPFVIHWSLR
ncbi:MAG: hypothetical protein ABIP42_11040, partial [Planctomycetota bacterium]